MRSSCFSILMCSALLLSAVTAAPEVAAEGAIQPAALDGFLGDFLKACHPSEAFDTLTSGLVVKAASGGWKLSGKLDVSSQLRPHIGPPRLISGPKDNGEATATLVVPIIAATFQGLKVKAITVDFSDNGDDVVIFDETEARVRSVLTDQVAAAAKNLGDPVLSIKLTTKNHAPALDCGHYS